MQDLFPPPAEKPQPTPKVIANPSKNQGAASRDPVLATQFDIGNVGVKMLFDLDPDTGGLHYVLVAKKDLGAVVDLAVHEGLIPQDDLVSIDATTTKTNLAVADINTQFA